MKQTLGMLSFLIILCSLAWALLFYSLPSVGPFGAGVISADLLVPKPSWASGACCRPDTAVPAALRKTMVRAHRQAWAWQDEWHGLTIDDIRRIELDTQRHLAAKFGAGSDDAGDSEDAEPRVEVRTAADAGELVASVERAIGLEDDCICAVIEVCTYFSP